MATVLSPDTMVSLHAALLRCREFDSDETLRDSFITTELMPFQKSLPSRNTPADRVDSTIAFLLSRPATEEPSLLIPYLEFLKKKRDNEQDADESRMLVDVIVLVKKELILPGRNAFKLQFQNRTDELRLVEGYLEQGRNVQVHAAGGLGKTIFLAELRNRHGDRKAPTAWIDLTSTEHRDCASNRYEFLRAFVEQVFPDRVPDVARLDEESVWRRIQPLLTDIENLLLVLDNADRGSTKLLTWLRDVFIGRVSERIVGFRVVASGQEKVPDWDGHKNGMIMFPLTGFENLAVIRAIICDVIDRFGSNKAKRRKSKNDDSWHNDLTTMVDQVYQISHGHLLAIERVLHHYYESDRFDNPNYIKENWGDIVDRCLEPIVGGYILPSMPRSMRLAFEELCTFRYVWPGLIGSLVEAHKSDASVGLWSSFQASTESESVVQSWWMVIRDTHLISDDIPRHMWQISPVTRQVIATVLKNRNDKEYVARNQWARYEYEQLLSSNEDTFLKAPHLLEALYHTTQCYAVASNEARDDLMRIVADFADTIMTSAEHFVVCNDLVRWLRLDHELRNAVSSVAGDDLYDEVIYRFKVLSGSFGSES